MTLRVVGIAIVVAPMAVVLVAMLALIATSSAFAIRDLVVPSRRRELDDYGIFGAILAAGFGIVLMGIAVYGVAYLVGW